MKTIRSRHFMQRIGAILIAVACTNTGPMGHTKTETSIEETTTEKRNTLSAVKAMTEEAQKLTRLGSYAAAEAAWRQILALINKRLEPNPYDTAFILNQLGFLLGKQGQHEEAEKSLRDSIATYQRDIGSDHPGFADSLTNLAELKSTQGQYAVAEPLLRRALAIYETNPEPDHLRIANALNNLGAILFERGKYAEAEPLYRRALAIREKVLGSGHPEFALSLYSLALLLSKQGQVGAAEPLFRRALSIQEKSLGQQKPELTFTLTRLAELLLIQGQYAAAETLLRRSLAIREKSFGANHPLVAVSLSNLASLLSDQGQDAAAELLYRRALIIQEKSHGQNHPYVASILTNLALLLTNQGQYAVAEPLYRRALAIQEKHLGENHPDVASSISNLSLLLLNQKNYSAAESAMLRALIIRQKALGENHPDVAVSLNNLALLMQEQGKHSEAESLFLRSISIYEIALGRDHPGAARIIENLAGLHQNTNQYHKSLSAIKRSFDIQSNWLIRELTLMPDQARSPQLHQLGRAWEVILSWIDSYPPAVQLALETHLNRQGLLPEIEQRQAQLLTSPNVDRDKVNQLQALTQQLASVMLPAERRSALRERQDRLRAELYRQLPDLQLKTVTTTAVAKALPSDGVLVEFQRYQPFDGRKSRVQRWGEAQYIALILKPNGNINSVPLGPAAAIDATVQKGLRSTAEGLSDADVLWAQLSDQVLRPLLPHLKGSRQWFFSPDGELNRVPFAALPAPQQPSTPLAAAVQLRLLTTGRELVRLQQPASAGRGAVVMANPSYDRQDGVAVAGTRSDATITVAQRRSADLGSNRWLSLPGTEREGQQVASLLGTRLISGLGASTTALQQQQGPRVLHVATHGFFVADQESAPSDPLLVIQDQAPQLRAFRGEDPLLRSGLVLAGANQPNIDPQDDGYLTAAEALMLKLKGTELVVLSACSTAQGDIRTGEGVYGLQRALTVAGARSTLLSLWKVDDAATAEFMTRFYRRLKAGEGRADALAAVQQEFRDGKTGNDTWRSPNYWAAWQLVGDWRPIQGL